MTLADYRTSDAVSVALAEPFGTRLGGLLDHFDGRLLILSGWRSTAEQIVLYGMRKTYELDPEAWVRDFPGQPIPAVAAFPGTSNHERGLAADLQLRDGLTWRLVHAEAETRGLRFPVAGEDWHCEPDPAFIDPPQEELPMDIEWRILAPIGTLARFIAPFARTPDREGWAALYATWLPTKARVDWWTARGAKEHAIPIGELAGVSLIGGLPAGDVHPWSVTDWQSVS